MRWAILGGVLLVAFLMGIGLWAFAITDSLGPEAGRASGPFAAILSGAGLLILCFLLVGRAARRRTRNGSGP